MIIYSLENLADILAQLVNFAWDDFGPDGDLPEQSQWTVAYQVACFTAQHTAGGNHGVETEAGMTGLRVAERLSYAERLSAAQSHVAEWNNS